MTRVILSLLCFLCVGTMFGQSKGWTLKPAVTHEMLSTKSLVDDVRALLPLGTYCTYSVKSQEIWIISDHSEEEQNAVVEFLNNNGHYVVQTNQKDKIQVAQKLADLKERFILDNYELYHEFDSKKVVMPKAEFDALPTKTQLKIAQSENVIVQ